ncbi:MAG: c-type cytochrome [Gammaproteobacteria bacterium]|nr:c-type cytochrome [Gammaproteobacteria bacterium]
MRIIQRVGVPVAAILAAVAITGCGESRKETSMSAEQLRVAAAVGAEAFTDSRFSQPPVLSCINCHDPAAGWADPRATAVSEGATAGFVGNRNAPGIAYARYLPRLTETVVDGVVEYRGGLFADGRINLLEMVGRSPVNNHISAYDPGHEAVAAAVRNAGYADDFLFAFGQDAFDGASHTVSHLGDAFGAYMESAEIPRFNSRYDRHLAGNSDFNEQELLGLSLFSDPSKGNCTACHSTSADALARRPLLTNHRFYNIGIPRNESSRWLDMPDSINPEGRDYVDPGLSRVTGREQDEGKFRVPTLRNVALTAPYGHNGYFATLEEIVHFYNVKNSGAYPAAEVAATEEKTEIGALGLTAEEEAAIVAFLRTLTD